VLLGELDRLQGMIDDLLLLARGDERAFARSAVDVTDVIHQVGARRRRLPVTIDVPDDPVMTTGDADALRRALDHVVANATRHAAGKVAVTVGLDDGEVHVHVDDDGRGIPPAEREHVVRRFVRFDEGRGETTVAPASAWL
jgi:signal transduction histidine kinase